jgi:hypothetical protein
MSQPSPTFIDRNAQQIYYLGFDLLLVHAPVRNGIAYATEAAVVQTTPHDPVLEARHAAIRAALLSASFGQDPAWAPIMRAANDRAVQLAAEAGLPSPPAPAAAMIVALTIEAETDLPAESAD